MAVHDLSWVPEWHNRFQGERLFVLATGPSLQEAEPYIEKLKHEKIWAVNFLHKWGPMKNQQVDFYGCSEMDFIHGIDYNARKFTKLLAVCANAGAPPSDYALWKGIYADKRLEMKDGHFMGLGDTFDRVAIAWNVVGNVPIQVGCWLGFTEIYLIGCDFTNTAHAYEEAGPMQRNEGNMKKARESFIVAHEAMKMSGRLLAAATYSSLSIPRVSLDELLGGPDEHNA